MFKLILFSIFFLSNVFYFGQQILTINGEVYDAIDKEESIPGAKVFLTSNPDKYVVTRADGKYFIQTDNLGQDTLVVRHVGFEVDSIVITAKTKLKTQKKDRFLNIDISLKYKELKQFNASINRVDTAYGNPLHSVEDFLVCDDGKMLLLAYEQTLKKGAKIVLADTLQNDITEKNIPGEGRSLFKDYAGNFYVICEQKVLQIEIVKNNIRFYDITLEDFYGFHHRVIDTIESNYYYSDFNELYPAVKFLVTNRLDSTHTQLTQVQDDFMMELYRAQFKYVSGRDKLWAYRKEQETGIDKEIWIGATSFTHDILYEPVYAPLFIIKDTVHIVNQYNGYMYRFDAHHDMVDSVKVSFFEDQGKEKWEQPLIKDPVTDRVLALYNKGGYYYIKHFDCHTGRVHDELKLHNRFVERLQIYGNKVYYIYRPFESLQKKFIYTETLE